MDADFFGGDYRQCYWHVDATNAVGYVAAVPVRP